MCQRRMKINLQLKTDVTVIKNITNNQEYNAMKNHESNKNSAFLMDKDFDLIENKQIKKKKTFI